MMLGLVLMNPLGKSLRAIKSFFIVCKIFYSNTC